MKFDFSLLKKCAFAVTLLSLSQIQGFADEDQPVSLQSHSEKKIEISPEESSLLSDSFLNDQAADDLIFDDDVFVAKNNKKRRKKRRKQCANPTFEEGAVSQIAAAQNENNTWIPRFVWIGDVQNSENLKCFAAFLIGSLSEHSQMGTTSEDQQFSPGFFTTPYNKEAQASLSTALNEDYIAQRPTPKQRARQRDQRQKARSMAPCPKARVYLDLHAGPSFLFFTEYKGNLMPKPTERYPVQTSSPNSLTIIKGRPKYNVVPLLEMSATLNILKWLGIGGYVQSSQGTYITTKAYNLTSNFNNNVGGGQLLNPQYSGRLQSAVDFYSVGGKVTFSFPDLVKLKTWSMGLFAAGGIGGGFQTWKNTTGYQNYVPNVGANPIFAGAGVDDNLVFNTTTLSNLTYMADAAISFKTRNPFPMTLLKFGCKFIGWGPVRNIGAAKSPDYIYQYIQPLQMGGIFSIVPYIGFTWSF